MKRRLDYDTGFTGTYEISSGANVNVFLNLSLKFLVRRRASSVALSASSYLKSNFRKFECYSYLLSLFVIVICYRYLLWLLDLPGQELFDSYLKHSIDFQKLKTLTDSLKTAVVLLDL